MRAAINNYFRKVLPKRATKEEEKAAKIQTIIHFPEFIDFFIKYKEDHGDDAESIASAKVAFSRMLYLQQFRQLSELLKSGTDFYKNTGETYAEAYQRVQFLKDVIENRGGHKVFYVKGEPIERESDLHILYRMTWFASPSDVTREANDGGGPVDFKVSRGAKDKTLVEFKLAKNSHLEQNLKRQTAVYEKASDAKQSIKVIVYFSAGERKRVEGILKKLKLADDKNVILIDARKDNKPSGSKA